MAEVLSHAIHRLMERTDQEVSRKEITRAIENRQMLFAKRLTSSRSLVYVTTPSGVVKVVLHKPTGKVITVLPWKAKFTDHLEWDHPKYGHFVADIYPDCFLETNCKTALTKIHRIHTDGAREPIAFNHPLFGTVYDDAIAKLKEKEGTDEIAIEAEAETNRDCESSCTLPEFSGQGAAGTAGAR